MTDAQKYCFDLQGYLVLEGVVSPELVAAANRAMDRYETMDPADFPPPLCLGGPDRPNHRYVSNILEGAPEMRPLIDLPAVIDVVRSVSGATFRLNHTYAMFSGRDYFTGLHMHGTPIIDICQYRAENGQIVSTLTKAVIPLVDCAAEDGCFAVIPGSHKSAFPKPWGNDPAENPLLIPVEARAGDVIVFTEALTHGSLVNRSGKARRTLYFCYSVGWMRDWGGQGLHFSPNAGDGLSAEQREILRLK